MSWVISKNLRFEQNQGNNILNLAALQAAAGRSGQAAFCQYAEIFEQACTLEYAAAQCNSGLPTYLTARISIC
jgi:hypothetical protein